MHLFVTELCINIAAWGDLQTTLEFHVLCCLYPRTWISLLTFLILKIVKMFMVSYSKCSIVEDGLTIIDCTPIFSHPSASAFGIESSVNLLQRTLFIWWYYRKRTSFERRKNGKFAFKKILFIDELSVIPFNCCHLIKGVYGSRISGCYKFATFRITVPSPPTGWADRWKLWRKNGSAATWPWRHSF